MKKNWTLFNWAAKHLKLGPVKSGRVYVKKCLRNKILLRLMDLSGVKPNDTFSNTKH